MEEEYQRLKNGGSGKNWDELCHYFVEFIKKTAPEVFYDNFFINQYIFCNDSLDDNHFSKIIKALMEINFDFFQPFQIQTLMSSLSNGINRYSSFILFTLSHSSCFSYSKQKEAVWIAQIISNYCQSNYKTSYFKNMPELIKITEKDNLLSGFPGTNYYFQELKKQYQQFLEKDILFKIIAGKEENAISLL